MAISDAQRLAVKNYRREKRDQLAVDVPKGKREVYHLMAKKLGLSLAQLIQNGVEEFSRNHAGEDWTANQLASVSAANQLTTVINGGASAQSGEMLTAEEKRLVELFGRVPERTRKNFLRLFSGLVEDFAARVDETDIQAG